MFRRQDPLEDAAPLIRRVYAYVAYRIGDGADADDVTGEVFARAVRYRTSFDRSKGEPAAWLLGIARHVLADRGTPPTVPLDEDWDGRPEERATADRIVDRVFLEQAIAGLSETDRELIALRYGADMSAREIAGLTGARTHAVEVALSRAISRLRARLAGTAMLV
jgi:RNA polymerase sigma factor (sigma-70 family)